MKTRPHIDSREHLFYLLAEAAEVEHCLMCCYLYAAFSLKSSLDEGVTGEELEAIQRWHRQIMGVAIEEMTHLGLVWNLSVALGSGPHVGRPNFPVGAGYFPSGVVAQLRAFDQQTIDHFVYLERPNILELGSPLVMPSDYVRPALTGRLMPSAQDYETVGELYGALREGLQRLALELGEEALFSGSGVVQLSRSLFNLEGLQPVTDLPSALAALDTIVTQGEGANAVTDRCHFAVFQGIQQELAALQLRRPAFEPGRRLALNPVMRPPPDASQRTWVSHPQACKLMDLANAAYSLMLRLLGQCPGRPSGDSAAPMLAAHSMRVMHAFGAFSRQLTRLPATADPALGNAGVSFAMLRDVSPLPHGVAEATVLTERAAQLAQTAHAYAAGDASLQPAARALQEVHHGLAQWLLTFGRGPSTAAAIPTATPVVAPAAFPAAAPADRRETPAIEVVAGRETIIHFEAGRCIHARHCVLALPAVFKANTPGQWIDPDAASPEALRAAAHNCPSGAIRVQAVGGPLPDEIPPPVNVLNVRENGPLALHGAMAVAGINVFRATLCRCGQSLNKPFCDGSHAKAGFVATGEPPTGEIPPLGIRDGILRVDALADGPLSVTGNLEICSGTGRTVARVQSARLCRCGHSSNKPFCDRTHASVGFIAPGIAG